MNEYISDFLNDYADNPDPQYAVLLTGDWGCGKTHFIKSWREKYTSKKYGKPSKRENSATLRPVYVSLFGLKSINDIRTEISKVIYPLLYSKGGKAVKSLLKIAERGVFNLNIAY
jgi:GTPase SAR1 family protein